METTIKSCKSCKKTIEDITAEGLICKHCNKSIHITCLSRQSVPGGLSGDVFFTLTCSDCSDSGCEVFERDKLTWLQALAISLYHMQTRSPGLARKGYFHWKIHISSFIDKYWDVLFKKDFKRKKKWMGTIAGSLSTNSPSYFQSGTSVFNEQGWWTLTFPRLTPNVLYQANASVMLEKQKMKEERKAFNESEALTKILLNRKLITEDEAKVLFRKQQPQFAMENEVVEKAAVNVVMQKEVVKTKPSQKRNGKRFHSKTLLPTLENFQETPKKYLKVELSENLQSTYSNECSSSTTSDTTAPSDEMISLPMKQMKLLDPFCHYNTSLKKLSNIKTESLKIKLLGGVRQDLILSPYSGLHLKPFIRRDATSFPSWLKLMAEIQLKANMKNPNYTLPPRAPLDFTYVQPEHIPAVNSLCNQFFWPGIDLTECLQYPDFSCVVLYRKLIVAFGFLVPDVKISENYMSFLFTRPGWRNVGIGRFMIYHLIQTSVGKDITLHVSINNPALFLYQKFGFKVEHVALDFYDKYIRSDSCESKHAFFCRLER